MPNDLDVVVNGKPHPVSPGTTLADLVAALGRKPELVAVERNGEIIPRTRYAETSLASGDKLEIVQFVQGGANHPVALGPLPSTATTL